MDYANIPLALFAGLFSVPPGSNAGLGRLPWPLDLQLPLPSSGYLWRRAANSIGLDGEFFKVAGAVLLLAAGFCLALPRLQTKLALAAAPLGNWTERSCAR